MNITGSFTFHNVGQGLFYSGNLNSSDGRVFNFVYDCGCIGSKSSLIQAVRNYRKITCLNSHKKLHLLILSHLHADHINGLKELLKNGIKVDTMVIPYFSETSKQLARIGSSRRDRFLQSFYDDPFGLLEGTVSRIIIVGTPDGEKNTEYGDNFTIDSEETSRPKRIFTGNNAVIKYRNLWEFSVENMPFPQSDIDSYVQWLTENNNGRTLDDLLQDTKFVRKFRRQTRAIFQASGCKDPINRTSVMMLHKPIAGNTCNDKCTILTGDVALYCEDSSRIVDSQNHGVFVLQIPHHGGYCGCIGRFMKLQAKHNVLSYGLKNKYGHPASDVTESLPPERTICVNEWQSFTYRITV